MAKVIIRGIRSISLRRPTDGEARAAKAGSIYLGPVGELHPDGRITINGWCDATDGGLAVGQRYVVIINRDWSYWIYLWTSTGRRIEGPIDIVDDPDEVRHRRLSAKRHAYRMAQLADDYF